MPAHRYSKLLREFIEKDVIGVKVTDEWPELAELKSQQGMAEGFRKAIKRTGMDNVRVVETFDGFYLIRPDMMVDLPNTSRRSVSYG